MALKLLIRVIIDLRDFKEHLFGVIGAGSP